MPYNIDTYLNNNTQRNSVLNLVKIEDNGVCVVAVFEEGFRKFCLDEEHLRQRIANLNAQGVNTSVEHIALASIKQKAKSISSSSQKSLALWPH